MSKRLTHEDFLERLKNINDKIECVTKYVVSTEKILIRCKICCHEWSATPKNLLKGKGCPKCKIDRLRYVFSKNGDIFIKQMADVNEDIEILGDYVNTHTKIEVRCKIDGNQWSTEPAVLLSGHGCPECMKLSNSKRFKMPHDEFIDKISNINNDIEILSRYINTRTHVRAMCRKCKNTWMVKPNNLICGKGCPSCSSSKGEKRIEDILMLYGVAFKKQKSFKNLIGVGMGSLTYDFYLRGHNTLIEFQGEQHESPIEYFGGEVTFKQQVEHDRRKREYASKNGIKLIEIWHYEFDNIEDILCRELKLKLKDVI